jgi:hypothetical protein
MRSTNLRAYVKAMAAVMIFQKVEKHEWKRQVEILQHAAWCTL